MASWRIWRHRLRRCRQWIIVSLSVILLVAIIFLISSHVQVFDAENLQTESVDSRQEPHVHVITTEHCSQPKVSPHDDQLFDRFSQNVSLVCPLDEVIMTYMDPETGNVSLNVKAIQNLRITCSYSFLVKKSGSDNRVVYSKPTEFPVNGSILLSSLSSTVNVSCTDGMGDMIYANTHLLVPKFESDIKCSPAKPNVLVILLGSLSQLTFNRLMKITKAEMESMKFQYLNYFVTLRDHPFSNVMALLTGNRMGPYSARISQRSYFDQKKRFKFLWTSFKDKNYTTGVMSDMGNAGLFHPSAKGFRDQPTDFYPNTFWNHVTPEKQRGHGTNLKDFCYGMNGHKVKIFLDQVLEFVNKNKNSPYFLLASLTQMTRMNVNHFELVDPFFADFFQKLKSSLSNTIVIFAGDYGLKNIPYVATGIGRLEERMSLFSVLVTKSVEQNYPHLKTLLSLNSDRLTSWLDVHVMLKDIAEQSFHRMSPARRKTIGMNPMRQEIPRDRSCDDAGILDEYCVCGNHVFLDLRTESIKSDIVSFNNSLQHYLQDRCHHMVPADLKYALYDIDNEALDREHLTVCFVVGNSRQRFMFNLTRHWRAEQLPEFRVVSDLFDSRVCNRS